MTTHDLLDAYEIPANWGRVHLRWLSKRYAGGTPDTKNPEYWEEGTVPWLNSGAVNQGTITEPSNYITEIALKESSAKWIPQGSLVMALAGQGKTKATVGYLDIQTTGNQSLAAIVPLEIEGKFLYWWLSSQYLTLRNLSSQDGRDGLNLEMIGSIVCPVPPRRTQRRIARFLDEKTARIDALIEKKRELLNRLAEKRNALISNAVTKGLNPDAPMKPSGIDWLRDIPAHWDVLRLKRILASSTYGISAPLETSGAIAVLRMGNLMNGEINFDDLRFLDDVDDDLLLVRHDVVLNRTNSLDLVGKASIFRGGQSFPVSLASYLVRFRFTESYSPEYANYVMGIPILMAFGRTLALPSIGQANLNPSRYALIEFPIPPYPEQSEIVAYLTDATNDICQIELKIGQSIKRLSEHRAALITAAVTGQIEKLM